MRVYGCGCTGAGVCLRECSVTKQRFAILSLWHLWLHHIFWHYLINRAIFGKQVRNIKCVFWFSLQLFFDTFFYSKKNWAKYCHKCWNVVMYIIHNSCRILMKLDFSLQIFEKISTIKFHHNPSNGSRVVTFRTYRHDEANSCFSQFCKPVKSCAFCWHDVFMCFLCLEHGHRLCRYFSINRLVFNIFSDNEPSCIMYINLIFQQFHFPFTFQNILFLHFMKLWNPKIENVPFMVSLNTTAVMGCSGGCC